MYNQRLRPALETKAAGQGSPRYRKRDDMNCWICGGPANTGEHRVKASDLKGYFGCVSQQNPIYMHTDQKKNIPIKSIKASRLKSGGRICDKCNNSLTQPYDKAWKTLSQYLQANWHQLQKAQQINLTKVFPGSIRSSLLGVHLYFVKIFGCAIAEHNVPIDLNGFSNALLKNEPHPYVFIAFIQTPGGDQKKKLAAVTPIQAMNDGGRCFYGDWMYIVGNVTVQIFYNEVQGNPAISKTWHPLKPTKIIPIKRIHA